MMDETPPSDPSRTNREEPPPDPHGSHHHAYKILVMIAKGVIGLLAFGYVLQYTLSHV
ncbi:MAG: hypothetical protein ACYCTV_03510 [Leptospirales bacterium]